MSGSWRAATALVTTFLLAACTVSTTQVSSNTPSQESPSTSPSASAAPSPSASQSPTAAPTPSGPGLAIAALRVHNGEMGVPYFPVTLSAQNGAPPYSWSVAGGGLPPGLTLSAAGVITGNHRKVGTFAFTVKVMDSAGATATGKASIKVFPAFTVSQPCARACNVGVGCTRCGTFGSISGGAGPYVYKLVSGIVPPGMRWNNLALIGAFPAPPPPNLAVGPPPPPQPFTVSVTDDFKVTRTVTAFWNIFPAVNFVPAPAGGAPSGGCYQPGSGVCDNVSSGYPISYSLGNPVDNVKVVVVRACFDDPNATLKCSDDAGAQPLAYYIPPGWSATASGGTVMVGMNCGQPDQCAAKTGGVQWFGDVFIVLVDKGACVAPAAVQSALTVDVNIDI